MSEKSDGEGVRGEVEIKGVLWAERVRVHGVKVLVPWEI